LITDTFPDYSRHFEKIYRKEPSICDLEYVGDESRMDEYILSNSTKIQKFKSHLGKTNKSPFSNASIYYEVIYLLNLLLVLS